MHQVGRSVPNISSQPIRTEPFWLTCVTQSEQSHFSFYQVLILTILLQDKVMEAQFKCTANQNWAKKNRETVCLFAMLVCSAQSWPSHWKMRSRCVAMLLEALFSDCERCDVKCFIKFPMNDICDERTKRVRAMFSDKDTQLSTAMG